MTCYILGGTFMLCRLNSQTVVSFELKIVDELVRRSVFTYLTFLHSLHGLLVNMPPISADET